MSPSTHTTSPSFWRELQPGDHACQIYRDDATLLDTLSGFVGGGLWAGESAIVIATDHHLLRLEEMLRETGLDLAHFRSIDAYIPLSVEDSLAMFMDGGWPDEVRFDEFVTPTIQRARHGGRAVRAFGEMVALLWARGHFAATVRLEHLWNKALERERIRLVCGYPRTSLARGHPNFLRQIDASHTVVVRA